MEELRKPDNSDVPLETICKWQAREIVKLNQIIVQKKKVIARLRNNITMMAKDPDIKAEIAREILFREKSRQVSNLQKELHRVRESNRKLLQTLLTYKLKEQNEQQGMQDTD